MNVTLFLCRSKLGKVDVFKYLGVLINAKLSYVNKLEDVQRFALRVISHQWDSTYEDLLSIVKIPKLQERRLKLKLTLVYKIAHGLCYFPAGVFVLHRSHSARLAKHHTMLCPHARTNYYFHSFVPSGVRAWNSLEELQACARSLHIFKRLVKDFCSLSSSI